MSRIRLLLVALLFSFTTNYLQAQVSGKVSNDAGAPLKDATITVVGKIFRTNDKGEFEITEALTQGTRISVSLPGYLSRTIRYRSGNTVEIILSKSNESEVVVTSFGIKKEKRSIGYATQELKGEEIVETQRDNWVNAITGRVAGATVNATSGAPGASSQIVLRGFNSVGGDNNALIIIDGVVFNNSTFSQGRLASDQPNRGLDYTNRAADINPEDIESITILKGPEAAALYGTEAGNGAIVITTKKGKIQPLKVTYNNNFRWEQITRFHDVQKLYDNGVNGQFTNTTRAFFGPKYAPGTKLYNNAKNFFDVGTTQNHNLTIDGGKGSTSYRGTASYFDQFGTIPNTRNQRVNVRLNINTKIGKKVELSNSIYYSNQYNRKAARGLGGFYLGLLEWPLDDDARIWKNLSNTRRIISKSAGVDNPTEANNPFFETQRNKYFDKSDRVGYNLNINYNATSWLNVDYRFSADGFTTYGASLYDRESFNFYTVGGRIEEYTNRFKGFTSNFLVTAKKTIGNVNLKLLLGHAIDDRTTTTWSIIGDSLNKFSDFIPIENVSVAENTSLLKRLNSRTQGRDTLILQRSMGAFFNAEFSYKDYLYVNVSGRNDWLAEFPKNRRSYFYPSVTSSFIFSELLPKNKIFTYGKLRASVAKTGKRIPPYSNQSVYTVAVGSTNSYGAAYGFGANNPNLFPEQQTAYEVGTEVKLLNNRIGFDVTFYRINIKNSVTPNARTSYGTGFILYTANIADLYNEGIEAIITANIIKKKKINWTTKFNIATTRNKVTKLPIPEFYNSDSFLAGYRASLYRGFPTTTIGGQDYLRNGKGQILIDPGTGYPLVNPNFVRIGDRNPDVVVGATNSFRYKNISFSFTLDWKQGGDILNGTEQRLVINGLSKRTLDRETIKIIPGVLNDGLQETNKPTINTIPINPYYQNDYYTGRTYAVDFVEKDINWLRLRDVTLSYTLGKKALKGLKIFSAASVFVTGTDLFLITNYSGVDPTTNGNSAATTGVGSFGIDLGNSATPIGINMGLRVAFKNGK